MLQRRRRRALREVVGALGDEGPVGHPEEGGDGVVAQCAVDSGENRSRAATTTSTITSSAGSKRRARRIQKSPRRICAVRRCSSSSSEVIRNPLSTKNTSTPRKPPDNPGMPPWSASTNATATARMPSNAGIPRWRWTALTAEILPARADAKVLDTPTERSLLRSPRPRRYLVSAMYFMSRYSSMPSEPPSRPNPDSLTPPNGAAGSEITPRLMPTMPAWMPSATRSARSSDWV